MATDLFDKDEIYISTYAGPERDDGKPRTMVQITNRNRFTGDGDMLLLSLDEWAALCEGIRHIAGRGGIFAAHRIWDNGKFITDNGA